MTPLVIVLGPVGSGRAATVKELVENAWPEGKHIRVLTEATELKEGADSSDSWTFKDGLAVLPQPGTEDATILITDGLRSAIEQMEALHRALAHSAWSLQRIITIVDCPLAHRHPVVSEWYNSCIHFSDAVILTRRWEVPGQWMSKFLETYDNAFYPCVFVNLLKNGSMANPATVVQGEPLRLTHIFDEIDAVDEMEFDEDNLPDEPFDLVRQPDKYFARDDFGRRLIAVPDIAPTLRAEGR